MAGKRPWAYTALGITCLILCLVCGAFFVRRKTELYLSGQTYGKVRSKMISEGGGNVRIIDTDRLLAVNPDYVFWLEISGTEISYPVVQTNNDSDYLRVSFTGEPCIGGCIFTDASCPPDLSGFNTVVYGHRMPDGTMFTALAGYLQEDFARERGELRIYIANEIRICRLCAVLRTDAFGDYARTAFADGEDFRHWLEEQRENAQVDTGLAVPDGARAVTLVTCAGNGSERLAVIWLMEE